MSGYNFKQKEWGEWPLSECFVGQQVVDALRDVGARVELQGWRCNKPTEYTLEFDEMDVDQMSDPSGRLNDVMFVAHNRRMRSYSVLGFKSEFIDGDPEWGYVEWDCRDFEERVNRGARTLLLRYFSLMLQDYSAMKPDEDRRKFRAERKAKIEKIKRTTPINPVRLRFMVLSRDHFRCRYCGRDASETKLHVDHILAKSKGGPDNLANYVTACQDCNLGKQDVLLLASKARKLMQLDEGQIPSFMALPG